MSFAIIRGSNGRRHEVDFKDDPVAVDVSMSESVVQPPSPQTPSITPPLLGLPRPLVACPGISIW